MGDFGPALGNFPAETVAAFRGVDFEIQYNLLLWSWRRFAFPAMAPALKALYLSPPDEWAKMRDLALRRYSELAPEDARPFMLAELQRNELRVSMVTLGRLPDAALPAFEPAWLRNLQDGVLDERLDAAVRIERFGSPAILADVKRRYAAGGSSWSCDVRVAVLGYLARVDAASAAPLIGGAATAPKGESEDCRPALLRSPTLRMAALGRLERTPTTVTAAGPVPGEEWRQRFRIDDEICESEDELIARLSELPSGTRLAWRYDAGTGTTHPQRWTRSEREALLASIRTRLAARGITLQP